MPVCSKGLPSLHSARLTLATLMSRFPVSRNYPQVIRNNILGLFGSIEPIAHSICLLVFEASNNSPVSIQRGQAFPILRAAADRALSWLFGQMWNKFSHIEKSCSSDQGLLNEQGPGHCPHFEQIEKMISFSRVMLELSIQPKIPWETAERARVTASSSLNRSPSPQPNQY